MKYLYKYRSGSTHMAIWSKPADRAGANELEYELLDTGVFDDERYFDV